MIAEVPRDEEALEDALAPGLAHPAPPLGVTEELDQAARALLDARDEVALDTVLDLQRDASSLAMR